VVDPIEFKSEKNPNSTRIGYYRLPERRPQWGSQTKITERVETSKRVLVEAAKQKR
jgi:hypothetical protein